MNRIAATNPPGRPLLNTMIQSYSKPPPLYRRANLGYWVSWIFVFVLRGHVNRFVVLTRGPPLAHDTRCDRCYEKPICVLSYTSRLELRTPREQDNTHRPRGWLPRPPAPIGKATPGHALAWCSYETRLSFGPLYERERETSIVPVSGSLTYVLCRFGEASCWLLTATLGLVSRSTIYRTLQDPS